MKKIVFLVIPMVFILGQAFADTDLGGAYQLPAQADTPVNNPDSLLSQKKEEEKKLGEVKAPVNALETRKKFNKLSKNTSQIYKVTMRSNVVYRLQTALGYVSTVDLPEPALKVFVGDAELFKVGVFEKEVLIKPITDYEDARTNLTIMTQSGRLTFDVSVGPAGTADFVLDFRLPEEDVLVENAFQRTLEEKKAVFQKAYEEKEKNLDQKAQDLAHAKLKKEVAKGAETILLRDSAEAGGVRVNLLSMSTIGEKAYLRFGIRNLFSAPYKISKVVIGAEAYDKKIFGLVEDPQGLTEFSSEFEITNPVAASDSVYGVVSFDRRTLGKKQYPVLLIFEEGGKRNLKTRSFKWIS